MNVDSLPSVTGIAGALAVVATMMGRLFPWRIRLGPVVAVLWFALLLFLFGYAVVRGEEAMYDFNKLGFVTDP